MMDLQHIQSTPATPLATVCNSTLLFYQFLQYVQPNVDSKCTQSLKDLWQDRQNESIHDGLREFQQHGNNETLMDFAQLQSRLERLESDHALELSKHLKENAFLSMELEKYTRKVREVNGDSFADEDSSVEAAQPGTNMRETQISSEVVCEKVAVGETLEEVNEGLIRATLIGSASLVKKYLECGADHDSAILLAASFGFSEIVELLLDRGADIDLGRKDGKWTPIHEAVKNGHVSVVRLLLSKGAKVDIRAGNICDPRQRPYSWQVSDSEESCDHGSTPLDVAVQYGHLNVVRVLLSMGADSDAITRDGCTPLYQASASGNVQIVQILLWYNASPNGKCVNDSTPLHVAVHYGHLNVVSMLLSNDAETDVRRRDGCTPLYQASSSGRVQVVQMLLEYNASTELMCENGTTPLHAAIQHKHLNVVRLLLNKGAEPDERIFPSRFSGYSFSFSRNPEINVALALVKYKVSLGRKYEQGSTPLHMAVMTNQLDVASVLLEHGADVNKRDSNDRTPLHLAAGYGDLEIVQLLIKHNADVNLTDTDGWSALHVATLSDHLQIARTLLESGADSNIQDDDFLITPLYVAIINGSTELVNLLIQHNANVNQLNKAGCTPLCTASSSPALASASDLKQIVKSLVEGGANVNVPCTFKMRTPLHMATMNGYEEIVKLLIQHNASINVPMKDGKTALHIAVIFNYIEIAEALIEAGADVNIQDTDGSFTLLDYAAYDGNLEMVKLLVNGIQHSKSNYSVPRDLAMHRGHKQVADYLASMGG